MKRFLLIVLILSASSSMAQNMSWEWAQGIVNGGSYDSYPFAVDSNGNTFVGGVLWDDFVVLNKDTIHGVSERDFFIAKFSNTGSFLWIKTFGLKEHNAIYDILIDKKNDLIVTGFYTDTINLNGIGLKSKTQKSSFYAKFTNDCEPIWVKSVYYQDSLFNAGVPKLATTTIDVNGNLYTCGYIGKPTFFNDTLIIPPNYDSPYFAGVFVAKFDKDANLIWVSPIGRIVTYRELGPVRKIAVGENKSIVITGVFEDTLKFGAVSLVSHYQDDAFILTFDSTGVPMWGKSFGSEPGLDIGENVAIDNSGNIIAIGIFYDSMNIDGVLLLTRDLYIPGGPIPSQENSFIIKYNAIGKLQWARSIYGRQNRTAGLTLDSLNNIYISGQLSDTNIFSDTTISFEGYSHHYYISKLDSNGDLKWLVNSEKVSNRYYGNEAVVLMNGSIYTVGSFEYTTPYLNLPVKQYPYYNIFIAKLSEANSSVDKRSTDRSLLLYPNPSSENSTINYKLPSPSPVTITLHDILGREVLHREMGVQSEGEHEESLDVNRLPIGSYIVRIHTDKEVFTSRISVVR
jgi:hypothetical protein